MKTRLLRKIRKRYKIVYYPNGFNSNGRVYHKGMYVLYGADMLEATIFKFGFCSKNQAIDHMVKDIKRKYGDKVKKTKYNGIKVWP